MLKRLGFVTAFTIAAACVGPGIGVASATRSSPARTMSAVYSGHNNLAAGAAPCSVTFRQIERDTLHDKRMGRLRLTIRYCTDLTGGGAISSGRFSIRLRNGDRIRGSYAATINDLGASMYTASLTVDGGTGRWRHATGTLEQDATIVSFVPAESWQVSGTLTGAITRRP
jgi:hypothetical protein